MRIYKIANRIKVPEQLLDDMYGFCEQVIPNLILQKTEEMLSTEYVQKNPELKKKLLEANSFYKGKEFPKEVPESSGMHDTQKMFDIHLGSLKYFQDLKNRGMVSDEDIESNPYFGKTLLGIRMSQKDGGVTGSIEPSMYHAGIININFPMFNLNGLEECKNTLHHELTHLFQDLLSAVIEMEQNKRDPTRKENRSESTSTEELTPFGLPPKKYRNDQYNQKYSPFLDGQRTREEIYKNYSLDDTEVYPWINGYYQKYKNFFDSETQRGKSHGDVFREIEKQINGDMFVSQLKQHNHPKYMFFISKLYNAISSN